MNKMRNVIIIIIAILILGPIIIITKGQEDIVFGVGVSIAVSILAYKPLVKLLAPKPEVKNEDDYEAEFFDDKVRIIYKDREFETEIKNVRVDKIPRLKDQNAKTASETLHFQIMNDVKKQYNELLEEKIRGMTLLNKNEVVSKFNGIKLANEKEKQEYLNYMKKVNKSVNKNLNIFRNLFLILIILSIFVTKDIGNLIITLIGLIIIELIRLGLGEYNERQIQKNINGKIYIADCYAYQVIKRESKKRGTRYYIKITDNKSGYFEEEFKVDYESVNTNNDIKARLYVIECDGEYDLDVCTERMLELGEI